MLDEVDLSPEDLNMTTADLDGLANDVIGALQNVVNDPAVMDEIIHGGEDAVREVEHLAEDMGLRN